MEGAGADFHVVGLQDDAAEVRPVALQRQDEPLERAFGRMWGGGMSSFMGRCWWNARPAVKPAPSSGGIAPDLRIAAFEGDRISVSRSTGSAGLPRTASRSAFARCTFLDAPAQQDRASDQSERQGQYRRHFSLRQARNAPTTHAPRAPRSRPRQDRHAMSRRSADAERARPNSRRSAAMSGI